MTKLNIKPDPNSYKIGINEITGLEVTMRDVMAPVLSILKSNIYWNDDLNFEVNEYKSRDGFIPYSHNLGGIELNVIIPKCEESNFSFLDFDECDTPDECQDECSCDSEGHLDSKLRIWFKLESVDQDTGEMQFYLYMGGGNADAPYFRNGREPTIFESEFSAKSLDDVKRKAKSHVNKLIKIIK